MECQGFIALLLEVYLPVDPDICQSITASNPYTLVRKTLCGGSAK